MPLRVGSEEAKPSEPVVATQHPTREIEEIRSVLRSEAEAKPEKGNLILKIVIGGIFAYVSVMAVGLCGMMFPRQAHEIARSIKLAKDYVHPDPPRARVTIVQTPTTVASPSTNAAAAPAVARKRTHRVETKVVNNSKYAGFEVVDPNHRHSLTPPPPTPSVPVSVAPTGNPQSN